MFILVGGNSIHIDHGLVGSGKILLAAGRRTALDKAYDAGWKPSAFTFLSKMPVLRPSALWAINTLNFRAGGIFILSGSAYIGPCKAFRFTSGSWRARVAHIRLDSRCIRPW